MGGTRTSLVLLLLAGGCHLALPLASGPEPPGDARVPGPEAGGPDLPVPVDARPAEPLPPLGLTCDLPALVGSSPPALGLVEPAMRADNRTLTARLEEGGAWYCTEREAEGKFGPWGPCTLGSLGDDPSFFERDGIEHVVVTSTAGSPRSLSRCVVASGVCTPLTINGLPAGVDLDGPFLRKGFLGLGEELFFAVTGKDGVPQLYRATAASIAGPYTAWPMELVNQPGVACDDPAVSSDGMFLVFGSGQPDGSGKLDLLAALGIPPLLPYERNAVIQLALNASVNSPHNDAAPEIVEISSSEGITTLELYFHSDRSGSPVDAGKSAIYRAACTLY